MTSTLPPLPTHVSIRPCAKFIPVERLSLVPDCGFFPMPRGVAFEKLRRLVAGAEVVRKELGAA